MPLDKALSRLLEKLIERPETCLGEFQLRVASINLPPTLPFSEELKLYYKTYDFDGILKGVGINFVAIDKLVKRQEDFKLDSNSWVVFADLNDDPIVAETSVEGTPVYAGIEAQDFQCIAPSMAEFFDLVRTYEETHHDLKSQGPDENDDIEALIDWKYRRVIPEFLQRAKSVTAKEFITAFDHFLHH